MDVVGSSCRCVLNTVISWRRGASRAPGLFAQLVQIRPLARGEMDRFFAGHGLPTFVSP